MKKFNWSRVILFLFVVLLGLVFINQIGLFEEQIATYPALQKELTNERQQDVIVFRHETLVASKKAGSVKLLVSDGVKVRAGTPVAEVNLSGDEKYLPYEAPKEMMIDIEPILKEYQTKQDELSYLVKENKYDQVQDVEKQLKRLLLIKKAYEEQKQLELSEVVSTGEYGGGKLLIQSPTAGLVSTTMATDDPLYQTGNIFLIQYDELKPHPPGKTLTEVKANEPFLRIVDNREFFFVFLADEETAKSFSTGKRIAAVVNGYSVKPIIDDIFPYGNKFGIVLKVTEDVPNLQNERFLKITLTIQKRKGLAIKNSSIIEKDKQLGVYLLKNNFQKTFVPIKILETFQDECIVESDYFSTVDADGKVTQTKTISLYDQIVEGK
ncbi:HlyD family efflux transporter periplasmic adaptor subunit [Guggenheimella bovis]